MKGRRNYELGSLVDELVKRECWKDAYTDWGYERLRFARAKDALVYLVDEKSEYSKLFEEYRNSLNTAKDDDINRIFELGKVT